MYFFPGYGWCSAWDEKAGARELNYLSDVDVIYVTEAPDPEHQDRRRGRQAMTITAAMTR